ncbi:hypothetical protein IMZ48_15835 [Candidatus Bathyarchaeota archaeon]|nr:hypothetical protein [Candidatus Bathyarchaeota archaeon]
MQVNLDEGSGLGVRAFLARSHAGGDGDISGSYNDLVVPLCAVVAAWLKVFLIKTQKKKKKEEKKRKDPEETSPLSP